MKILVLVFFVILCINISNAFCFEQSKQNDTFCFNQAGEMYNVSPVVLWAISKVESNFNNVAINYNNNGYGYDYCHMQINSRWYASLKHVWNNLSDPCFCTKVGAWILSQCIQKYGNTWDAIGCYNAKSKNKRIKYASKIYKAIKEIGY